MSEVVLDGLNWRDRIMESTVLKNLLNDKEFLNELMQKVIKSFYKGASGLDAVSLIKGLESVLEHDETVRRAAMRVPGVNGPLEFRSLLHWYAIMIHSKARELNLIFVRTRVVGDRGNE